ncbi:MAG: hypothetical protein V4564_19820 [Pseudomonadota bacterium]|uniref:hypothetical protein n=1 Tax=Sphingomonas sp. ERG5 TaxID=1381597 RepID=UPI00054B159B|nr:hypothetical protein [Sphingomonas sp. ERG5]
MILLGLIALLVPVQGSMGLSARERVRLMDAIDTTVRLPIGARPLQQYARFYSVRPDGKIAVLFDADTKTKRPKGYRCSLLMPDGSFKKVQCPPDTRPEANERHWVKPSEMPLIFDGGCGVIDMLYDPRTAKVEQIACHGEA